MSFALPDLVIESVIRDGLTTLKNDPQRLDDVFGGLLDAYADRKYGAGELTRIRDIIQNQNIAVVHSFHEGAAKSPAYSIQLGQDGEDRSQDALDDHLNELRQDITVQAELDALKKVDPFTPTAYYPLSGAISVADSFDLSPVRAGNIFEASDGLNYTIRPGISNVPGDKFFFILPNLTPEPALGVGLIRSAITENQVEVKVVVNETQILIGVHTKEALLTKYMYTILKAILQFRKTDLINRGFDNPILRGSDFTRDLEYAGDMVFTRFLTLTGRTEDVWLDSPSPIIDDIQIPNLSNGPVNC